MFDFRVITCADGIQVIDHSLKTPYNALSPVQMQEYMEIDAQIVAMERMKRKAKRVEGRRKKASGNLFYKAAYMLGLV